MDQGTRIGALKLALTNIRHFQECVESEELYSRLDGVMYALSDIVEETEAALATSEQKDAQPAEVSRG